MKTRFLRFIALHLGLAALPLASVATETVLAAPTRPATTPNAKVDINTATAAELEKLPGIGTDFANAVIAARPFHSVDELARVRGIGAEKLQALRDKITASPVVSPATKPDSSSTSKVSPPSPTNDGKAIDNKTVTARYDRATEAHPPVKNSAAETPAILVIDSPPAGSDRETISEAGAGPVPLIDQNPSTNVPIIGVEKTINVNTATKAELEALPGIAPTTAQAIIDSRPFISREDLLRVRGVNEGLFETIREKITVQ